MSELSNLDDLCLDEIFNNLIFEDKIHFGLSCNKLWAQFMIFFRFLLRNKYKNKKFFYVQKCEVYGV